MRWANKRTRTFASPWMPLLLMMMVSMASWGVADESSSFRATTYFPKNDCVGTPYTINYDRSNPKDPPTKDGCTNGANAISWTDTSGVTDLFVDAWSRFGGTQAFLLYSDFPGCGKFTEGDTQQQATAFAATGECFATHDYSGRVKASVSAQFKSNGKKAVLHMFLDGNCQVLDQKAEVSPYCKRLGPGFCVRGQVWQVFDGTRPNWDRGISLAPPTGTPSNIPSPSTASNTTAPTSTVAWTPTNAPDTTSTTSTASSRSVAVANKSATNRSTSNGSDSMHVDLRATIANATSRPPSTSFSTPPPVSSMVPQSTRKSPSKPSSSSPSCSQPKTLTLVLVSVEAIASLLF